MQLKQGTLLQGGKYRIEKVLGQGGFGITYLAMQVNLNRKVAIKEFFMKEIKEMVDGLTFIMTDPEQALEKVREVDNNDHEYTVLRSIRPMDDVEEEQYKLFSSTRNTFTCLLKNYSAIKSHNTQYYIS